MESKERNEASDLTKVLESESYTVMTLCDDLYMIRDDDIMWSDGSCCACPSYTTAPCSC